MNEIICDVYWDGPHKWEEKPPFKLGHVLCSLHGTHPLYGRDVLLYIGKTDVDMDTRLSQHAWWVEEELDVVTLKFASIRVFEGNDSIENWRRNDDERKPDVTCSKKAAPDIVREVEALLIYAHQPAFNTSGKVSLNVRRGLRIFNTGKLGLLHPELSWAYFDETPEPPTVD